MSNSQAAQDGLSLEWAPSGRNGTVTVTAKLNGEAVLLDKLDIAKEPSLRGAVQAGVSAIVVQCDSIPHHIECIGWGC